MLRNLHKENNDNGYKPKQFKVDEEVFQKLVRVKYLIEVPDDKIIGTECILWAILEDDQNAFYFALQKQIGRKKLERFVAFLESLDMKQDYKETVFFQSQVLSLNVSEDFMQIFSKLPTKKEITFDTLIYHLLHTKECNAYQMLSALINPEADDLNLCLPTKRKETKEAMRQVEQLKEKKQNLASEISIPKELEDCCEILNSKFCYDEQLVIRERDKEIRRIWNVFARKQKRNPLLIGAAGVGKTAIVEGITEQIVKGICPLKFADKVVISLDVNSLVAGTKYRGDFEEKTQKLVCFLQENPRVILFIDEVHLIIGAGKSEGSIDFANVLKPILARGDTMVIGATTTEEYHKFFSEDKALKRRFEPIEVKEPSYNRIYSMLEGKIKELERYHHVMISKDVFEFVKLQATCYDYHTSNPDRTLTLLDDAMALAMLEGKRELSKEEVIKVHQSNMEEFYLMDEKQKKATAYHEAGHYLVYQYSIAKHIYDLIAISIIPTLKYQGINILLRKERDEVIQDRECFISLIGLRLAGKIAEKKYTFSSNAGAFDDLAEASELARNMVLFWGMEEEYENLSLYNKKKKEIDYELMSEQEKMLIHKKMKSVLEEAQEKAEAILDQHKGELELLAENLMQEGMLTKTQIDILLEGIDKKLIKG